MDFKSFLWDKEPNRMLGKDINDLLVYCTDLGASDITMQTDMPIKMEIHGKLYSVTKRAMTPAEMRDILSHIYQSEGGIGRLMGGEELTFSYEIKPERGVRLRFRGCATNISIQGAAEIELTMRTIPGLPPKIESLNLEKEILDNFAPSKGLVLVTGATGSGKSTLLAAGIRWLAEDPNSNRKILTYEHPIEFVYDDIEKPTTIISQVEIGKGLASFAAGLRNALRRKPTVILVGEARDAETVGECITASMTGHLTYSTAHSNGVADTIRRMVNVFKEEEKHARAVDILTSIRMIISQQLVPSTDGKRVALREYLIFNDEIVDELLSAGMENLTRTARSVLKKHGQTFLADATKKFKEGKISEFEFKKVRAVSKGTDLDSEV